LGEQDAVADRRADVTLDERPWGCFRQYTLNEPTTVKLITVDPRSSLSLQWHRDRDELWIVLDDGLEIQVGEDITAAAAGDEFFISRGTMHRVRAGASGGRFVEICFGTFDEDDIERVEDAYGRA